MAQKPHQDAQGSSSRELGLPIRIHNAHIPPIVSALPVVRRLHHRGRQVKVRERAVLLRPTERVAPPAVYRQRARFDVDDARQPGVLRAQELLGDLQIGVDVGRGAEEDMPQQEGHVAREVVVDGSGREEHDPGRLAEGFKCADHGAGGLLAEAAAGDVVVGGDDHEDGAAVPDAGGEGLLVMDAALEDLDPPAGFDVGEKP